MVSKIERMIENYDQQPIQAIELADLNKEQVIDYEWSPIALSGKYLSDQELLVRNRPIAGQPGFLQLVPFQSDSGQIILIERGWIQADSNLQPAKSFTPSSDTKLLVARVRLSELTPNRSSPEGQVTSLKLDDLASLIPNLEKDFYLRLISESPTEQGFPQALGKPVLDEGNHLSYAVQFILFALMGFYALHWGIRQEREFRKMEDDPTHVPKSLRKKKKSDGDIEDELLDAKSN